MSLMTHDDVTKSNSLADLAARVRHEHEAAADAIKRGAAHAMHAGDFLIEAKEQLQHGQWLPWLKDHCAISERTAQLYMRLARDREKIEAAKSATVADLSLREAAAVLAPDPIEQMRAEGEAILKRIADARSKHTLTCEPTNEARTTT
jgi:hypothetical protein